MKPSDQTPQDLGLIDLVEETVATSVQLVEKQVELLRAEMHQAFEIQKRRFIVMLTGVTVALIGVTVLLVAAALGAGARFGHAGYFALGIALAFLVAGAAMIVAELRSRRDAKLGNSRQTIKDEIAWAKDELREARSAR